jgi:hypothetical protein
MADEGGATLAAGHGRQDSIAEVHSAELHGRCVQRTGTLVTALMSPRALLLTRSSLPGPVPSAAMGFFNKAAEVAEKAGHHPDFHLTNYR